jgi:hypothetical protein
MDVELDVLYWVPLHPANGPGLGFPRAVLHAEVFFDILCLFFQILRNQ